MTIEITTELLLTLLGLGGSGGVGGVVIAFIKYRATKKEHEEAIIEAIAQKGTVEGALVSEVASTLYEIKSTLQMGFRVKVNESHQEVMQIKKLAWCKQQDDLYNGLKKIIRVNNLQDELSRIKDIRDLLQTIIRDTDETLNKFNLQQYMAPTEDKILFVCGGEHPRILYKIITSQHNTDYQKLEDSIRTYGQIILNSVKTEFYDGQGRAKLDSERFHQGEQE